jgi:membrane-associated protease RseP (regulator of RpoE activity)
VIPHRTAGRGCRVGTVIEFGQADQAGICPNDAIVSVSGVSVEGASPNEIAASLNRTRPVEVTFRRSPEEGATVPPKQLESLPDVVQKRHQIERHERHQIGGPAVTKLALRMSFSFMSFQAPMSPQGKIKSRTTARLHAPTLPAPVQQPRLID